MADTLQEYLVGLGFRIDEPAHQRFVSAINSAKSAAVQLGATMVATAAFVYAAVEKVAREYETLYYVGQRNNATVAGLQAQEFGFRQIGLSAEQSRASVEAFGSAVRLNPGVAALFGGTGDTQRDLLRTVDRLRNAFGPGGYFAAARMAGIAGIDEVTFRQLWLNLDRLKREQVDFARRQREAGIDSKQASERFVEFARDVNRMSSSIGMLGQRIALDFLDPTQKGVRALDEFIQFINRTDVATRGWALTLTTVLGGALGAILLRASSLKTLLRGLTPLALFEALTMMKADEANENRGRSALRKLLGIPETEEERLAVPWTPGGAGGKKTLRDLVTSEPPGPPAPPGGGGSAFGGLGWEPLGWRDPLPPRPAVAPAATSLPPRPAAAPMMPPSAPITPSPGFGGLGPVTQTNKTDIHVAAGPTAMATAREVMDGQGRVNADALRNLSQRIR